MAEEKTEQREKERDRYDTGRLTSFSDGVFAVAITLLVLSIAVPELPKHRADDLLGRELVNLIPIYWAYVISFFVIGLFWFGHHRIFIKVAEHDVGLFWLNLLFLMCVVFIPFPTQVMAQYSDSVVSTIFYACSISGAGIVVCLLLAYVKAKKLADLPPSFYVPFYSGYLSMVTVFLLSVPIAPLSVSVAKYFWLVLIPLDFFQERVLVKKVLERISARGG